jgi:hypothetical protein
MSKWAAIDTAVRLQLALDGKEVNYTKRYGTPPDADAQQIEQTAQQNSQQIAELIRDISQDGNFQQHPQQYNQRIIETVVRQNAQNWVRLSTDELTKLLLNVANRLKFDKPPLFFVWRRLEPEKINGKTLAMIVCLIEDLTEEGKNQ